MRRFFARATVALISTVALLTFAVPGAANAVQEWTSPVTISSDGSDGSTNPIQMATTPDGMIVAVWPQFRLGGAYVIMTSTSSDQGLNWTTPLAVSDVNGHAEGPRVAVNGSGTIMVAWDADVSSSWKTVMSRSTDGGVSWTAPLVISDPVAATEGFALTGALDDSFVVAMQQHNGSFFDVVSRETSDNGDTWSSFTTLSDGLSNAISVDIAADSGGNIAASWLKDDSGTTYHPVFRDSMDAGQTWNSIMTPSTSGQDAQLTSPHMMSAETGHFSQVWLATDGTAGYVMSTDELMGSSWRTPTAVATSDSAIASFVFAVAHNHSGFIAAVWGYNDGTHIQVRMVRSFDNGANWDSTSQVIAQLPNSPAVPFYIPVLAVDETGAMTLAWQCAKSIEMDQDYIRAISSTDFGESWSEIADVSAPGSIAPGLISLGSGNFVLSWTKLFLESDHKIQMSSYLPAHLPDTGAPEKDFSANTIAALMFIFVGAVAAISAAVSTRRHRRISGR